MSDQEQQSDLPDFFSPDVKRGEPIQGTLSVPGSQRWKARITVLDRCYHQTADGQAVESSTSFVRLLDTDEQPYQRKTKVGREWTPLPVGWVGDCSLMVLKNEEKEDGASILLKTGTGNAFAFLAPGESLRFCPVDLTDLFLRSSSQEEVKEAKYSVTLFPA